jgi:hypothetical protein
MGHPALRNSTKDGAPELILGSEMWAARRLLFAGVQLLHDS